MSSTNGQVNRQHVSYCSGIMLDESEKRWKVWLNCCCVPEYWVTELWDRLLVMKILMSKSIFIFAGKFDAKPCVVWILPWFVIYSFDVWEKNSTCCWTNITQILRDIWIYSIWWWCWWWLLLTCQKKIGEILNPHQQIT